MRDQTQSSAQALPDLIPYDPNELLLGYQKRWIADESPLKIAEKSRRTGITWAEAADACLTASASKSAGGKNHFYVGSTKEMAREFIDAVAMWARHFNKAASEISEEVIKDEDKDILSFVVYFDSTLKVQALSSNPRNLRGMQGNVTIDEAAHHDRLNEVLKAALALTMWGAKVRLISTHNGYDNLFNELIQDSRAGKKSYSVHQITLDDACNEGLYQRICQVADEEWTPQKEAQWKDELIKNTDSREDALEEYYCVPKQGGGAYLSRTLIESRAEPIPVMRFDGDAEFNALPEFKRAHIVDDWCREQLSPLLATLSDALSHVFGEDFGRSGDLTVIWPLVIERNLTRRTPFVVELNNVPFKQQEQILMYITSRLPRLQAGALDARGNGQYLAEQAAEQYGKRIQCVMLSNSWYLDNLPRLKAAFEDGLITIPRDTDILSDLRALQVIKGTPKLPDHKTGDKKNRHGDAAIALAMAWFASLQDVAPIEYTAASNASVWQPNDEDNDDNLTTGGAW